MGEVIKNKKKILKKFAEAYRNKSQLTFIIILILCSAIPTTLDSSNYRAEKKIKASIKQKKTNYVQLSMD